MAGGAGKAVMGVAMANNGPRRAYVLKLDLQADSREALLSALQYVDFLVASEQISSGISAGYDASYTYSLDIDESITHDAYMAAINGWLAEKRERDSGNE